MAEVASAWVTLAPSAKGFGGKISSQIGGDLDRAGADGGKRMGKGLSGGFLPSIKGLMGPVAALFAVGAITSFFKSANDEARESQKVGAITANAIKVTGGAAKITAGQVGDLSMALSNKSGVDDEVIQSGANLLLTFKNVKNEVGAGAQVFDRATAAAVDLSAAGFGDVAGSSKMLGKALNDPIAGLTALGRAGVTFSAGQKKQIEGMVKAGDVLGAQKIILAEVESQVGGAAAASATAGEKLATTFGNFKETIGTALLPVLDSVMTKASEFLTFLMANVGPAFTTVTTFLAPVIAGVKEFFTSFSTGGGPGAITGQFAPLVAFFKGQVVPAVMAIVTAVQAFVAVALPIVQQFVAGMMARIQPMLPTIQAIFGQIGVVITSALELIRAVIARVTTVIKFVWETWGGSIMSFISGVWAKILVVIQAALNIIQGVIKTVTSVIKGDWSGAWNGIKQILSGAWDAIKGIVSAALNIVGGLMSGAWALIKGGASAAWGAIKTVISAAWDGIKSAVVAKAGELVAFVRSIPGKMVSALGNLGGLLVSAGADIVRGLISGIGSMAGAVTSALLALLPAPLRKFANKLGIASPSKVFAQFGKFIGEGLIVGMTSTKDKIATTSKSLATHLTAVFTERAKIKQNAVIDALRDEVDRLVPLAKKRKGLAGELAAARDALDDAMKLRATATNLGFAAADAVMTGLRSQTLALTRLATSRAGVAEKLKDANARLEDAVKVRNDFSATLAASVRSFGSVIGAAVTKDAEGAEMALTSANIVDQLTTRLAAVKTFVVNMAALKASGLNKTAYEQLIGAGVEGGAAAAAALAAGGTAVVASVNTLQTQINAQGLKLGLDSARTLFQAGVDTAQGLLKGLQSQEAALVAQMRRIAALMAQAVTSKLKIKSPSRVFADIGANIGQGLVVGVDGSRAGVAAAMTGLVSLPRVGSLDFASSAERASAVAGCGAGATSADIKALGDRIGAELERQARTIQTMQRQMA